MKIKYSLLVVVLLSVGYFTVTYFGGDINDRQEKITLTNDQKPKKIAKKDRIDLAMKHEFHMTHDPALGHVPRERLKQAREVREAKIQKEQAQAQNAKILGVTWTERGPNNVGGRTRALMWDPNDAGNTKVWAGSVTGGLWYNNDITNASTVWQSVDDTWDNIAISAITYDPNNTNIMYVGTGEGHLIGSTRGEGMYKSTDGGSTWTHMTVANGFYATDVNFHYVNDIIVKNESGTSVLYVGTQESVNEYTYFGYSSTGKRGLWRSADGGVTFTQVLPNVSGQSYPYPVADIEMNSSGRIFVGTTQDIDASAPAYTAGGGVILYSDDGTTWGIAYNPGAGKRVELACAPSDPDVVYAVASDGSNVQWMVKTAVGDQASPTTWTGITVPKYKNQGSSPCSDSGDDFTRDQAFYNLILAVNPTDATILFVGGIDLYRSTNSGTSFGLISYWTGGCDTYVHADQHAIVFNPNSVNEAIIGNDGGVYYTSDMTAANPVISARNNGYNVTQFYGAAIHPTAGTDHFLAGAQDNGSQRFSSAGMNSTTEVSGGDGAYCNIDQDEPSYQWTQYVYNNYFRSTNGGSSFNQSLLTFGTNSGRFINPSRYDDTQNIMYAAAGTDQFLRWTNPQTGTTHAFVTASLGGGQVSAITISPNTANRIFLGTGTGLSSGPGGKVYRIDNAHTGASVTTTDISGVSFPANGYISCIEVENGNDDHILVTFSNFGVSSIWETTDGGTNWTAVEGDLPDMPVRWALFHPLDNTAAIIATELGVWTTSALNGASTTWGPSNTGLSNVRTDMLQLRPSDNEVIAATHGRGLFSSSSFATPPSTDPEISFASASTTDVETSQMAAGAGDCRPYKDHTITMNIANPPTGDATVTLSLGVGTTATEWIDFVFTTNGDFTSAGKSNVLSFLDGSTDSKTFTVRIYDDAAIESSEVIEFEFAITGATDAIKAATKIVHTFTITDNDEQPTGTVTLLEEDFEDGVSPPSGWSLATAGGITSVNSWRVDTENAITGTYSAHVSSSSATGDYDVTDNARTLLLTPEIDATGYTDMTLSFNYRCNGELSGGTYYDFGQLGYTLDGSSFTLFGPKFQGVIDPAVNYQVILPAAVENTTFNLIFYWENDASIGGNPAFVIDDVSITVEGGATIASTLNYASEQYLGPNETVMFYDAGTDELVAKIVNTSGHDYGCTLVTIDRAGTGTTEFWSASTGNYLMDKTVFVNPAINNVSGTYDITLYYTSTEVDNWITATSKTVSDLKLAKVSSAISAINSSSSGDFNPELGSANSAVTFGDGYAITSSFTTGFSGIGAGDPGPVPVALPLTLIAFDANTVRDDIKLTWVSATEENTDYISVEYSPNGKDFQSIGKVNAAGNSETRIDYEFIHRDVVYGHHYYRLKMVDLDGSFEYSWLANAFQNKSDFDILQLYPVPVSDILTVNYSSDNSNPTSVKLINYLGNIVYSTQVDGQAGLNTTTIDCRDLKNGMYILSFSNKGRDITRRVMVRR